MVYRKSHSEGLSAPKGKGKLAAFSALVEEVERGRQPPVEMALVRALHRTEVMRCSRLWSAFSEQLGSTNDRQRPTSRLLLPSQDLPPLP